MAKTMPMHAGDSRTRDRWTQFEVFPTFLERPTSRTGADGPLYRQRGWDWKARIAELNPNGILGDRVAELERVLRIGGSHPAYRNSLATLEVWRSSGMLDGSVQRKIASLLSKIHPQ